MAAYTVEEIFNGSKYSVMSEVVKEILLSGPYESVEDEQTAIEMATCLDSFQTTEITL